jgi:uroporphyrinogen-III synthase
MTGALHGKRVVNTRAEHQAGDLDALLHARGALPLAYPCIATKAPDDSAELDTALGQLILGDFDWLALTSANTVHSLHQRLKALGVRLPDPRRFRTAAVGPATAEAARSLLGLRVELVPDEYLAEGLAAALRPAAGTRILLPEAAIARPTLAESLRAAGAQVITVTAYRTVRGRGGVAVPRLLDAGEIDAVTFTSSSTVTYFLERLREEGDPAQARLHEVCLACIGPKTAETVYQHGLQSAVIAAEHTLAGLVDGLEFYFAERINQKDGAHSHGNH